MRRFLRTLRSCPQPVPPPDLIARIRAALRTASVQDGAAAPASVAPAAWQAGTIGPERRRRVGRWGWYGVAVAAACLLLWLLLPWPWRGEPVLSVARFLPAASPAPVAGRPPRDVLAVLVDEHLRYARRVQVGPGTTSPMEALELTSFVPADPWGDW